jgi:hypothetical protein
MKVFKDANGKVYALPWTNYTLGLLYNRPSSPRPASIRTSRRRRGPRSATRQEDHRARRRAHRLRRLQQNNTGGWHFTAEIYSIGGDIATRSGDTWKAAFNNDKGKQVLSSSTTCAGPTTRWATSSCWSTPTC